MYYKLILAITLLVVQCFSYQRDLDCFVEKDTGIINKESRWGNWIFNSSYCKDIRKDYFDKKDLEEEEAKRAELEEALKAEREARKAEMEAKRAEEEAYNDSIEEYKELHKHDCYFEYQRTSIAGGLKRKIYYTIDGDNVTIEFKMSVNTSGNGDYSIITEGDFIDIYHNGEKIAIVEVYEDYIRGKCLINGADINHISACIRAYKRKN